MESEMKRELRQGVADGEQVDEAEVGASGYAAPRLRQVSQRAGQLPARRAHED